MISKSEVSELFIVLFGRPTEGEGNTYWVNESSANGWGMIETSNAILNLDITKSFLGETLNNNESFVKHLFKNAVNLTEFVSDEQKAGLKYWVDLLDNGTVSKADLVGHFVNAAKDPSNAGANQDLFNNKVIVSNYVADTIAKLPLDGLTPDQQNALIQKTVDIINNVTSNSSSVESAKGEVDGLKEALDNPAIDIEKTQAFTTGADKLIGTSGDDIFLGNKDTIQPGDIVDGGAGNDTLKAFGGATLQGVIVQNVENVEVYNSTSEDVIDTTTITGLEKLSLIRSEVKNNAIAGASISNGQTISYSEVVGTAANGEATATITSGNAKSINLELNATKNYITTVVLSDALETLNLTTTGKVTMAKATTDSLNAAGLTTLNLKSTGTLALNLGNTANNADALKTIDASTSTANITLNLVDTHLKALESIKLGSGNDKVNAIAGVTIDGGAGNDTLVLKDALLLNEKDLSTFTNFEGVIVEAAISSGKVDLGKLGFSSLGLKDSVSSTAVITVDSGTTISFLADGKEIYDGGLLVKGAAAAADTTLNIALDGSELTNAKLDATIAGIKDVNIINLNSIDSGDKANTGNKLTISKLEYTDDTDSKKAGTVINITGNDKTELVLAATSKDVVTKVDAGALDGGLKIDLSTNGLKNGATLIGGKGDDVITIKDTAKNNIIIDLSAGGSDTVKVSDDSGLKNSYSVVNGFGKDDKIEITVAHAINAAITKLDNIKDTSSFSDILDLAAAGSNAETNAILKYFHFDGDTYIVADNKNATTFQDTGDTLIKLAGIHELTSNASTTTATITIAE
ncbi:surface layer protein SapA12 [Campylobacter fetus subsp. fetus]|uniref:hypothetical protein n=2 Tax=Campylobacter fetus TaxID=196 RepID=UPI000DA3EB6B|nr:hypothetical protein [Campylobacter fetus]KAA8730854.1 hypothetical protein F4U97_08730 [Campylobacter fetus subsp. fetus]SQH29823.1 surface layer protein SapA12 [Campylobacter fetus subsp. fetus]